MNDKIEQYHYEEIILILLIIVSDLSNYEEEDLILFTEDIEGRIDVLFNKDFLSQLNNKYGFTNEIIVQLENISREIQKLYGSQWHKKLPKLSFDLKYLANRCLSLLKTKYIEPKLYIESHLDVNW